MTITHLIKENDVGWVKKYIKIRVEVRRSVVRPRTLENVVADMAELEIDRADVHDRKKRRKNVMKRKSNPIGNEL